MGIYTTKFALESTADIIQTPDDVGVDLDQVEKAIMGPDGIEGHRSDIDDADEGTVGDPLEEAYMIMYESQYNYDQILQAIGMRELSEAASGRELVLEAMDIKAFFTNIKKVITDMFEKLTSALSKFLSNFDVQAKMDKKFVEKYKDQIIAGAKEFKGEFKGYQFPDNIGLQDINSTLAYSMYEKKSLDLSTSNTTEFPPAEEDHAKLIKHVSGIDADNIKDMNEKLVLQLHGGTNEKTDMKGKLSADWAIKILSTDRDTKSIKDSYKTIKALYSKALKDIGNMEKDIKKANNDTMAKSMAICDHYAKLIVFEKNALHNVYVLTLRAAKEKRAQARALAHAYRKAAPAVQHNSAYTNYGSIFSNMQFV